MNNYSIISTLFIIGSGMVYTIERSVAHIVWATIRGSVAIHGSGSWPSKPDFDVANKNYFVWILLVLGIIMLLVSVIKKEKKSKKSIL